MESYTNKSPNASRMGKASEYLVAAVCILVSQGKLNVSTSLVDDEGVDLVFHRRGGVATLAVQVKARMLSGSAAGGGRYQTLVRSQTFAPRKDLAMLFVAVNDEQGQLETAWLVPSVVFDNQKGAPAARGSYRFAASLKPDSQDKWAPFRLTPHELPAAILHRLDELELSGH